MSYPRILINTSMIERNIEKVVEVAKNENMDIAGVTKGYCAHPKIVEAYVNGGVKYLADSRIENLKKLKGFNLPKIMLRLPMISETQELVKYADISLNSEFDTIKALSEAAIDNDKVHKIILMVDLGDLREGFFKEEELFSTIEKVLSLDNIKIIGIGTNLTCYGGVIPNKNLLSKLDYLSKTIYERYNINLEIVSGGNSSTVHLLGEEKLEGINHVRLGEALIFGTESVYGSQIFGTEANPFTLEAQVIEIKEKPSVPTEKIGRDAFGNIPTFVDRGIRKRMICAIGKQDVDFDSLYPLDKDLIILGGSSDHLIIDCSDSDIEYKIGDIIQFNLHYVSLLRAMTSEYVEKVFICE